MSATILPFPRRPARLPVLDRRTTLAGLSAHFGEGWATRHMPLVVAALDLLQADDRDFAHRCRTIAAEPGALVRLVDQLGRLTGHMQDVADALAMTTQRIRTAPAQPRPA